MTEQQLERVKRAFADEQRITEPEDFWINPDLYDAISALVAEIVRFREDYSLFEDLVPPDVPKKEFVKWCFDAWEEKHK